MRADFQTVAAGLGLLEGPVALGEDRVRLASATRGLLYDVSLLTGDVQTAAEPGGGPSGLAQAPDGRWWIAQSGRVIRREVVPVAPAIQVFDGDAVIDHRDPILAHPSDICVGPDGRIWFSDPQGQTTDSDPGSGAVRSFEPATSSFATHGEGFAYPNGIAFRPGTGELYLAETVRRRIWRAVLSEQGLGPFELFAELPMAEPDGLAFDVDGNLYVAGSAEDNIPILARDGRVMDVIKFEVSTFPTNLCFAGRERRLLVVTAGRGGRLLATAWPVPGAVI
jgi:gluconolactonase